MSPTYAADLSKLIDVVQALWAVPNTRYAIILLVVAGVFALVTMNFGKTATTSRYQRGADDDVRRPTNTPMLQRLWWRIHPPTDLMCIDGLVIDRSRKPHCAWLAPTGGGKSASVATIRCDGKRVVLAVTPDLSDPLIEAIERIGGVRWTACGTMLPINFLIGTPTEVAERLTEVFRSGGVGAWKRAARMATADVIRIIDQSGEPRSLKLIGTGLAQAVKADRELKTACAGWVARFLDLADQFGPSIGTAGLDIADMLNAGISVLLDNDSFNHTALGGDVVALGLAEAKRCASLVPGGFRLIFEEAGQLAERIDLAEPFFRAGRRRKITVDVLTQSEGDLTEGISSNVSTRVYFAQELKSLQKVAADRLGLNHTDLDPANLKDFHAYISHGKIRRLVHFPKPPRTATQRTRQNEPANLKTESPPARRFTIEELATEPVETFSALPPPALVVRELLDQIDKSGHCHVWTGTVDRDGYGIFRWNGNWKRVHRIVWELTVGPVPLDDNGKPLDLDHLCRNRLCSKTDHLEPVTRGENVRRMWAYRGKKGRAAI